MVHNTVSSLWIGTDLTNLEVMCIKSFLDKGYTYNLYIYDYVRNIPAGVIIKDGNIVLDKKYLYTYRNSSYSAISNHFRFELMKRGEIWVDTDMLCVKYYDFSKNEFLFTSECDKKYLKQKYNAGIIKIPKDHPSIEDAISMCKDAKNKILNGEMVWGLGPQIVSDIVYKYKLRKHVKPWNFSNSCNNKHFRTIVDNTYDPSNDKTLKGCELKYFNRVSDIPNDTYFIHMWNEFWRRDEIDKNSKFPDGTFIEELKLMYLYNKYIKMNRIFCGDLIKDNAISDMIMDKINDICIYTKTGNRIKPLDSLSINSRIVYILMKLLNGNRLLEIGTGRGTTSYIVSLLQNVHSVVSLDIISFDEKMNTYINFDSINISNSDIYNLIEYNEKEKIKFLNETTDIEYAKKLNIKPFNYNVYMKQNNKFNMCFIDANPKLYDNVKADIEVAKKVISNNGLILITNYGYDNYVTKYINEIYDDDDMINYKFLLINTTLSQPKNGILVMGKKSNPIFNTLMKYA